MTDQQPQSEKIVPLEVFSIGYNKWYQHFLNGDNSPDRIKFAQIRSVEQVLLPISLKQFGSLHSQLIKEFLSFLTQNAPTGINVWLNSMNDEASKFLADTNQLRLLAVSERMKAESAQQQSSQNNHN
jgi:hypothetical protein